MIALCHTFMCGQNMWVLVLLVAACGSAVSQKGCVDCVVYTECPACYNRVLKGKSNETIALLKSSYCGMENFDNSVKAPKVCCSEWSEEVVAFPSRSGDPVETHANIGLLPAECGGTASDRIVGGRIVLMYEMPWMALLAYNTRFGLDFQCGGTIINSRYILTAAHCVRRNLLGVRLGEYNMKERKDCQNKGLQTICEEHLQDTGVEAVVIHENYTPEFENDIALLRLNNTIDFSHKNVDPICLPVDQKVRSAPRAERMTVAGWGMTEVGKTSDVLLKTLVNIYSDDRCNNALRVRYPNKTLVDGHIICAGAMGRDSCDGDSGGPLMYESEYKGAYRVIQGGIISQGPKYCGLSPLPGMYTDVAQYMEWILDHLEP